MNFNHQNPAYLKTIGEQFIFQKNKLAVHTPLGSFSYGGLYQQILLLINEFKNLPDKRIGIVIDDSPEMYAAVLACWFTGKAYVPLSSDYPINRLTKIISLSGIEVLWENKISINQNVGVKRVVKHSSLIKQKCIEEEWICNTITSDEAYILFTSGTSGEPKGVPISHSNLQAFVDGYNDLNYSITSEDRFLQMFELTFDLSVMSFMIPLNFGATFYTHDKSKIKPFALYEILDNYSITFALLVPSVVNLLQPYLKEMELPNLKVTQFCGETLTIKQVIDWKQCCPNSQIDNVYGPTEATIYCSRYTAIPSDSIKHKNGIVCIGEPLFGSFFEINGDELCLGGNQITTGYLNTSNHQNDKFYQNNVHRFYRSGDIGYKEDGFFYCLGRLDHQIKIQGHRIETAEIEYVCENNINLGKCIVMQYRKDFHECLVLFTQKHSSLISDELLKVELSKYLPSYMIPHLIHRVIDFPLNSNGKIDRKQLLEWIN